MGRPMVHQIFCLVFAAVFALSAATEVSLSGTVKDESGKAIAGAVVSLVNGASLKDTTDAQGAFALTGNIAGAVKADQQGNINSICGEYLGVPSGCRSFFEQWSAGCVSSARQAYSRKTEFFTPGNGSRILCDENYSRPGYHDNKTNEYRYRILYQ
jgi:hypothetical protein